MTRTGIIYGYTNLESGKMYIGQTLHTERRWHAHRYGKYKSGWHKDYQNNPEKYEYSVIEYDVPEDKLNEREIFWISFFDSYHNGYNLTPGGDGIPKGYKHTDEWKHNHSIKMSGKNHPMYGRHHTEEAKQKMSAKKKGENNPFYGRHHSEETLIKFRGENNPFYGRHHSEETKQKISIKNSNPSLETRKKMSDNHADVSGENNPMYGKKLSKESRKKISDAIKGRHWYNNGIVQIQSFECPIGFTKGMLKNKK